MKEKQVSKSDVVAASFRLSKDHKVIDCDENFADILGTTCDALRGSDPTGYLVNERLEVGRKVELARHGEPQQYRVEVLSDNGDLYNFDVKAEPHGDGEVKLNIEAKLIDEGTEVTEAPQTSPDPMAFENISDERVREISQAIRVQGPEGMLDLAEIMLDVTRGHNELEQYKRGALALYEALDERLAEEEKRNPDSDECQVIREVKRTAFGLYLRVQRGDMELHGDRDGRYSGYYT
jgi:hypothetical protein